MEHKEGLHKSSRIFLYIGWNENNQGCFLFKIFLCFNTFWFFRLVFSRLIRGRLITIVITPHFEFAFRSYGPLTWKKIVQLFKNMYIWLQTRKHLCHCSNEKDNPERNNLKLTCMFVSRNSADQFKNCFLKIYSSSLVPTRYRKQSIKHQFKTCLR
jgi:hypothetical protein